MVEEIQVEPEKQEESEQEDSGFDCS